MGELPPYGHAGRRWHGFAAALATDGTLAFRNVFRQRERSAGALMAVVFGVTAYLLAAGFIEWTLWGMREETIGSRLGHLQIARRGYFERGTADPWSYLLPAHGTLEGRLRREPRVREVAPRLEFTGLASHGETTLSFIGEGVEPGAERKLTRLLQIVEGTGLDEAGETGAVVGRGLAANLGVTVGDTIVMLANTPGGGINGVEARVRGIFSTASTGYDDYTLRVPLGVAQTLMRNEGVHKWVVVLDRTESTDAVVRELRPLLESEGLDIRPWTAFADFYAKTARLFERQVQAVALIIAIIIVLGISNSLMMAVLERTTEIGTTLALGAERAHVLRRFVFEGLLIGLAGGLLGVALGAACAAVISHVGIPMPPAPGMAKGYRAEISVTPALAAHAVLLALTTAFAASLYPAWKGARLSIVDALRQGH